MDAINHVKIHPFPSPSFRTALSKPRNLSYFPLKIRSRPKKGENRPRLRTERLDSWVSKIARLREDTTQKTTTIFCPQRHQTSRVTTLQKHRHPGSQRGKLARNQRNKKNLSSPAHCQRASSKQRRPGLLLSRFEIYTAIPPLQWLEQ